MKSSGFISNSFYYFYETIVLGKEDMKVNNAY